MAFVAIVYLATQMAVSYRTERESGPDAFVDPITVMELVPPWPGIRGSFFEGAFPFLASFTLTEPVMNSIIET